MVNKLKISLLFICLIGSLLHGFTQNELPQKIGTLSISYDGLIYQSRFALNSSIGFEVLFDKEFNQQILAGTGLRFGTADFRSEGFIRIGLFQDFGTWHPSISFETGITNRIYFNDETKLLKETREAMLHNLGNAYIASHVEMMRLKIKKKWDISILEIDFGTHYKAFGKTIRFKTNLVKVGLIF